MDSLTIMLIAGSLVLAVVLNAMKLMRFINFLTGAGRRAPTQGRHYESQMSFDDRLAEKLRELERDRRP